MAKRPAADLTDEQMATLRQTARYLAGRWALDEADCLAQLWLEAVRWGPHDPARGSFGNWVRRCLYARTRAALTGERAPVDVGHHDRLGDAAPAFAGQPGDTDELRSEHLGPGHGGIVHGPQLRNADRLSTAPDQTERLEAADRRAMLVWALRRLNEQQRHLITACHGLNGRGSMTDAAYSRLTGIHERQVTKMRQRAEARLARLLAFWARFNVRAA